MPLLKSVRDLLFPPPLRMPETLPSNLPASEETWARRAIVLVRSNTDLINENQKLRLDVARLDRLMLDAAPLIDRAKTWREKLDDNQYSHYCLAIQDLRQAVLDFVDNEQYLDCACCGLAMPSSQEDKTEYQDEEHIWCQECEAINVIAVDDEGDDPGAYVTSFTCSHGVDDQSECAKCDDKEKS